MTMGYTTAIRNAGLDEIITQIDKGSGAGHLHFYSGAQPSTGGPATTMLAELVMSAVSFAAASGGEIIANAVASTTALATGTATWFRIDDSDENFAIDGTVGIAGSGADLILDNVDFVLGAPVTQDSVVIVAGNP